MDPPQRASASWDIRAPILADPHLFREPARVFSFPASVYSGEASCGKRRSYFFFTKPIVQQDEAYNILPLSARLSVRTAISST